MRFNNKTETRATTQILAGRGVGHVGQHGHAQWRRQTMLVKKSFSAGGKNNAATLANTFVFKMFGGFKGF